MQPPAADSQRSCCGIEELQDIKLMVLGSLKNRFRRLLLLLRASNRYSLSLSPSLSLSLSLSFAAYLSCLTAGAAANYLWLYVA
jgi:hypothetical protein